MLKDHWLRTRHLDLVRFSQNSEMILQPSSSERVAQGIVTALTGVETN